MKPISYSKSCATKVMGYNIICTVHGYYKELGKQSICTFKPEKSDAHNSSSISDVNCFSLKGKMKVGILISDVAFIITRKGKKKQTNKKKQQIDVLISDAASLERESKLMEKQN